MSGAHGWQALSTHSPSETIAVRHGAPSGWLSHAPTSSGFAQYVGGAAQASVSGHTHDAPSLSHCCDFGPRHPTESATRPIAAYRSMPGRDDNIVALLG